MALLRFLETPDPVLRGRALSLEDALLSIGRDPANRIPLDDGSASRRHAEILRAPEGWWIRDLGSANGTLVNDLPVEKAWLKHGDHIRIGDTVLVFEEPEAPGPAAVEAAESPAQEPSVGGEDLSGAQCPLCGKRLKTGVPYCGACGAQAEPESMPPEARQRRSRWPLVLGGFLAGVAILAAAATGLWYFLREKGRVQVSRGEVFQAALQFRAQGMNAFTQAFNKHAGPSARETLAVLDETVWPVSNSGIGWSYLLGTSLVCAGKSRGGEHPVAYYHPWSDVFFVTVWSASEDGKIRIKDVEMLMGDFVRKGGKPPFHTSWIWESDPDGAPLALGRAAARTVRAFDQEFDSSFFSIGGWRSAMRALNDPELLEANRQGAGAMLARNMGGLAALLSPAGEDKTARWVHVRMARIAGLARQGRFSGLFEEGKNSLPSARDALLAAGPDLWTRLRPVAYLPGEGDALVLLSKYDQTDVFLALRFTLMGRSAKLDRIDVFSFNAFSNEPAGGDPAS
jgi:hypothetical protein